VIPRILVRVFELAVLLSLAFDQRVAQSPTTYPPLGQLVDVGGYRVHLYCTGEGSPTVIVVVGGFSFDWGLVQPHVATFTKVCTYDVSGTAWSDPGPLLTCRERVNEVHKLLKNARIESPFVVVGLSVGALIARLYASLHLSEIAGLVIVDHAFIDVGDDLISSNSSPPSLPGLDSPPELIYKTPIILTVEETSDFSKLPEPIQKLHRWAESLKPVLPTVETAEDCLSQLKGTNRDPHPFGNAPLLVVSTHNDHPNYKKLQIELLSLSNRSKQLVAERSFHSVEIDQPEVVVHAIRQVLDMVRQSEKPVKPEERH
jgi:pimeloyl-ACP methyl ester carboxylesterase